MKSQAKQLFQANGKSGRSKAPSAAPYRSPAERRAEGKTLRDAVPRADQSGWNPPKNRPDPVELVLAQNEGRLVDLVPIRHGRMLQSPFAFYRETAAIMAADLAHTPSSGLRVQACGDAHLSNFGAFATPERDVIFDVNDLDETLPAPWEWDVKRLTASVVLAGRHIQLKQRESAAAARAKDNPPLIFHHPDTKEDMESGNITEAWALYHESLPEHVRVLFDRFHLCDMAVKVVGVGSVGTACLIGLFIAGDDDPLFLQIKEANASVLEPYAGKSLHSSHGQRVVVGQRLMQAASDIFLGWTQGRRGRPFYVRQLRDMKLSAIIEGLDDEILRGYAEACGWALDRAHARSGDAAMISGYMGSGRIFDEAIGDFAVDYADQAERDHKAFVQAVREGRVTALVES